jgi:hypothetical protein
MSPAWVCPACNSAIHFLDYERARFGIMRKLQLRTVSDLVRYAIRDKIVQP